MPSRNGSRPPLRDPRLTMLIQAMRGVRDCAQALSEMNGAPAAKATSARRFASMTPPPQSRALPARHCPVPGSIALFWVLFGQVVLAAELAGMDGAARGHGHRRVGVLVCREGEVGHRHRGRAEDDE